MSRYRDALLAALALVLLAAGPAMAQLGLGRPATPAEIAAWDTDIRADGTGLPPGQGTAAEGEEIFAENCATCHGEFGEGQGRWPALAGGQDTLTDERAVKTVGSYWPWAPTLWDYIARAMVPYSGADLDADAIYALTAYVLYLNDIVEDDAFVLDATTLPAIEMPNRDAFRPDDRAQVELPLFRDACMTGCKPDVRITRRAAGKDVTPGPPEPDPR